MKCLLVSDLHYTLKQYDWIQSVAGDFDMVVIAGDHLDISSTVEMDVQILVILKYLRRLTERARVVTCSGNHDLNTRNDAGERTATWLAKAGPDGVLVDGGSFVADDTLFTICPWWDGPHARGEVGTQLERDAGVAKTRWAWVYHSPPDQSPVSWVGERHIGDVDLLQWIHRYRPAMVLTGHIHQSPFRRGGSWVDRIGDTWVFNSGRQIGPIPAHVIIDTTEREARWHSLAGSEVVHLDRELTRPVAELR